MGGKIVQDERGYIERPGCTISLDLIKNIRESIVCVGKV